MPRKTHLGMTLGTSGTNRTAIPVTGGPCVILVRPQLGENIGMAIRAMYNFGLTDLRLVNPRDGWPNEKAVIAAVGADVVLEGARVFPDLPSAIEDLHYVYATTVRRRRMVKPVLTPRAFAGDARTRFAAGERLGLLFGPERSGLETDEIPFADAIITAPVNPAFASLNLSQAVLLVAYEWFQAGFEGLQTDMPMGRTVRASKDELHAFFDHLEGELEQANFFIGEDKKPSMVRNLRTMWQRAQLTDQEIRTLRGVVKALVEGKRGR